MSKLIGTFLLSALFCGLAVLGLQSGLLPDRTLDDAGRRPTAVVWAHNGADDDAGAFMQQTNTAEGEDSSVLPLLMLVQNQTIDLTGDWTLTWSGVFGDRQVALHIDQSGSRLSGNASGRRMSGSIHGDQVNFNIEAALGTVTLTGTVAGSRMRGTTGKGRPWTASR